MTKSLEIAVEKDHIESLTKASGITAISELIWNSLDADATEINIEYKKNPIGSYDYIKVMDNGHGLSYENANEIFSKLGGSVKKIKNTSPGGRLYHGKLGKGRYKSIALGNLVKFSSVYKGKNKDQFSTFSVVIDENNLTRTELSDLKTVKKGEAEQGFTVFIQNVNSKIADEALMYEHRKDLEEKFAPYWISYPVFDIFINKNKLEFSSLIKNTDEQNVFIKIGDSDYKFTIKIIEWNFDNKRKTFLCNSQGIPFHETNIGIRTSLPISIIIQSLYIEKLHKENSLDLFESNEYIQDAIKASKEYAREYTRRRIHENSKEFIAELKKDNIYPYTGKAENIIDETKRQVFDIVALNIHEHLPSFDDQELKFKKLTLKLVSEALENDSKSLRKILTEVVELPEDKRDEMVELLESTSLSNMIDAMTEIKNRLQFINALEQLIYDSDLSKTVKERKHLHKIIIEETWIFGDEYKYGVDDLTLKNVLKDFLKNCLGREDFEEILNSNNNDDLQTIPDVCLWQSYSRGSSGFENLIIELKKPTVDAGFIEKTQIESYASKVSRDPRFNSEKTKWKFILVTRDIKDEILPSIKQKDRKYGQVTVGENFEVYILRWGDIITDAKIKLNYIKEKLNFNLKDNSEGLTYIQNKYKEYLP